MSNKERFFLNWFFSGNFFKALKATIEHEIQNGENAFSITFFNGNQEYIDEFMNSTVPKLTKGNVTDKHISYINKVSLIYLKQIILGEVSLLDDPVLSVGARIQTHMNINENNVNTVSAFMQEQYGKFRNSKRCISYIKTLNGQVCGYCDKGIIDCTDIHFYGDLDHIRDKSTYHYYALNINNLVPCCKVCNQKKSKYSVLYNPLNMTLDDVFYFFIDDESVLKLAHGLESNFDICVKLKSKSADMDTILENLNERLSLDDRYKNSGLVVNHIAQLKKIYTKSYLDNVTEILGDNYSSDKLKMLLLGDFSINKTAKIQPLTKLVRDIAKQINLFDEYK